MSELVLLIAEFGLPNVIAAGVLYIVLHGEVRFQYPQSPRRGRARVVNAGADLVALSRLATSQDRRHRAGAAVAVHNGDYPKRLFIGRVGY